MGDLSRLHRFFLPFPLALLASACAPGGERDGDAEGQLGDGTSYVAQEGDSASETGPIGRWEWVSFQGMDDSSLEIADPSRYALELRSDGVAVQADCNQGTGGHELDGASLTFTSFAVTEMACPGESHADTYLHHLGYVRSWIVEDGDLYLSLFADGGIMRFRPATVAEDRIRVERVEFEQGATDAVAEGSITGYEIVDHVLGAREGQYLSVSMETDNTASYFNILAPGETEVAFFNGSMSENRYEGVLDESGDYRIRVYMMRSAARRNEVANYTLEMARSFP